MGTETLVTAGSFTPGQIAVTAVVTGVVAFAAALWRLPRGAWADRVAVGVLAGASVFLWRISANMPELNSDGLPGFSAADWLAPVMTYLFLSVYADLRVPADAPRYRQTRALAVIASLVVDVVTL
ncbi:hypothetical protein ORV05_16435 [Amycolatopsis cynarae]|uniref:Uncharacterized protein n=1 Tax=Amycolatopsis cynarae TaxID=2995223 RepID=A0ABY7BEF3_9PSEU|nr:hypothetical protein [Amycolatopsis sp. HUAS 11-8]WAL69286.1 hypothetical protein ORV05_16435 [Amycolatopsis sp. HUAS 11-8]